MPHPLVLLILDGWGHRTETRYNAIASAPTPTLDALNAQTEHTTLLDASGAAVGLPDGQMGNSEVGHLCLGSGRIVEQHLMRIHKSIESGAFFDNHAYQTAIAYACSHGGCVHIVGLLSPGGVHSHEQHIYAALRMALRHKPRAIYVHALLDGRDTPPRSALSSLQDLQKLCAQLNAENDAPLAHIGSICGRYYAMDRDTRWERTQQAWRLLVHGDAPHSAQTAVAGLEAAYKRGESDEFVLPTVIEPATRITKEDAVLLMNFRPDRMRQLGQALFNTDFQGFERDTDLVLHREQFVMTTNYDQNIDAACAFPREQLHATLGEHIAKSGYTQLRLAETEKYAHVTFFFNGGREDPFEGESRVLVPSPKVATYDMKPEMSAVELTEKVVQAIRAGKHQLIICNYANGDMVGHTGVFDAALQAVRTVDECVGKILEALRIADGECLITADHGNCEQMHDPRSKQAYTAHTTSLVPFIYSGGRRLKMRSGGGLSDVAPSVLSLLGLTQPPEMTGRPLFDFV